ncbi:MAG: c-type cytochrome [Anaerolineales bacterium]|nr:c-type cytochrome [Anaerolineales bacterium]
MSEEHKKTVLENYKIALQKGERFWPDSIFKDLLVSFGLFILLILLATFVGVPFEPNADPSDTTYVPRPEWYFLFLFKFLALYGQIPLLGKIEWIATVIIPGVAILTLVLLPFFDKNRSRYYGNRTLALTVMALMVVSIVLLTLIANVSTTSTEGVYIPGILQTVASLVIPGLTLIALFLLGLVFKKVARSVMVWLTGVSSGLMIIMTIATLALAPPPVAEAVEVPGTLPEQILTGQDLYSIYCVECHGDDGSVAVIEGVKGLEGEKITPINSRDVLYTITDSAMQEVIAYGRPNAGMTPFGRAYGGELSTSEISYLVTFVRYSWDDRFELPPAAISSIPALAAGEVPSYEVHIQPLTKRYCLSCHRAGKENNNYLMDTYENMLNTGDNAPVMAAGDANSLLLQLINGHESTDPKTGKTIRQMPPTKLLKPEFIDMLTRWVMAGMPKTAEEAKALASTPPGSIEGPTATPTP